MTKQACVVFSGGPDSTAAALWGLEQGYTIELLTFLFRLDAQYGELNSAIKVASSLNLKHTVINFTSVMSQFADNVHILMHAGTPTGMKQEAQAHKMPFGAGMILSTAANYAVYHGVKNLIWGATKADAGGGNYEYTNEFAVELARLVRLSTGSEFTIHVPFHAQFKHQLFSYFTNRTDLFDKTWSCKVERVTQCGVCKACVARRVSTRMASLVDNTAYQSATYVAPYTEDEIARPELIDVSRRLGGEGSEMA